MSNSNFDLSGNLRKSLKEYGFPTNWEQMSRDELASLEPYIKQKLDAVEMNNKEFSAHWAKVVDYKNLLKTAEQRLQSEIEGLQKENPYDEQPKSVKELKWHIWAWKIRLNSEKEPWVVEDRNYEELMNVKNILETRLHQKK